MKHENPTIVTAYNYDPSDNPGELTTKKSVTVPDQSLTVEEILDLYARGIGIDSIYHEGSGLDDPSFDDLDPTQRPDFDIIEAHQILGDVNQRLQNTEEGSTQQQQPTDTSSQVQSQAESEGTK